MGGGVGAGGQGLRDEGNRFTRNYRVGQPGLRPPAPAELDNPPGGILMEEYGGDATNSRLCLPIGPR